MKPLYAILAVIAAWAGGYGASSAVAASRDGFIVAMESLFQVAPGTRKPVIQCQCSVEYLYTRRSEGFGSRKVYAVYIEKLD